MLRPHACVATIIASQLCLTSTRTIHWPDSKRARPRYARAQHERVRGSGGLTTLSTGQPARSPKHERNSRGCAPGFPRSTATISGIQPAAELDARARLLRATVGFALVPPIESGLRQHRTSTCRALRVTRGIERPMEMPEVAVRLGAHGTDERVVSKPTTQPARSCRSSLPSPASVGA